MLLCCSVQDLKQNKSVYHLSLVEYLIGNTGVESTLAVCQCLLRANVCLVQAIPRSRCITENRLTASCSFLFCTPLTTCAVVYRAARNLPSFEQLDLSACCVSWRSAEVVAALIRVRASALPPSPTLLSAHCSLGYAYCLLKCAFDLWSLAATACHSLTSAVINSNVNKSATCYCVHCWNVANASVKKLCVQACRNKFYSCRVSDSVNAATSSACQSRNSSTCDNRVTPISSMYS